MSAAEPVTNGVKEEKAAKPVKEESDGAGKQTAPEGSANTPDDSPRAGGGGAGGGGKRYPPRRRDDRRRRGDRRFTDRRDRNRHPQNKNRSNPDENNQNHEGKELKPIDPRLRYEKNLTRLVSEEFEIKELLPRSSSDQANKPEEAEGESKEADSESKEVDKRYRGVIHVAWDFYPFLIGVGSGSKRRIEDESGTHIWFPRKDSRSKRVGIEGPSEESILKAVDLIDGRILVCRQRMEPTHFISIPVQIDGLEEFKRRVLDHEECSKAQGISENIFLTGNKLHFTLVMLSLTDGQDRKIAGKVLEEVMEEYKTAHPGALDGPLKVHLKGVASTARDPARSHVLYAQMAPSADAPAGCHNGALQELANLVMSRYASYGLMAGNAHEHKSQEGEEGGDLVTMHVTIARSQIAPRTDTAGGDEPGRGGRFGKGRRYGPKVPINGSPVLEAFGDYDFGQATATEVHLSQRFSFDPDGYYKCLSKVAI